MQLKFKRIQFDEIHGASFNGYMVAGDLIGGAEENDDELVEISESIISDMMYRTEGPVDLDTFNENFSFKNNKGLFESNKPIQVSYSKIDFVIHDSTIDYLEDDEDDIKLIIKERITQIDNFLYKLIDELEFDFEV